MSSPVTADPLTGVVDCGVDHGWASPAELLEYLPRSWRDYVGEPGSLPGGAGARSLLLNSAYAPPQRAPADAAFAGTLAPAVADLETLRRDWLDPEGISIALLTHGAMRSVSACVNPYLARALVRATNDWTIERWLDADDGGRVRGTVLVDEQVPAEARAEIERVGAHPKMAAVLVGGSGTGKAAGHPVWDPIYAAAVDAELPVLIHAGGDTVQDNATYPTAGGPPGTYAELRALGAQPLMTHLVSLIGQGAFERHPRLRVLLAGGGSSWLPSIVWRFDTNYRSLRIEAPWVKRRPSEYLADHVRVTTRPLDGPRDPAAIASVATAYPELAELAVFASGFPERGHARPAHLAERLPQSWLEGVRSGNAEKFLRVDRILG